MVFATAQKTIVPLGNGAEEKGGQLQVSHQFGLHIVGRQLPERLTRHQ